MVSYRIIMTLLVVMVLKHFCADFILQTPSIARGKAAPEHWLVPLLLHAGGHALITLVIALLYFPWAWWLAPIEWIVHACIDRFKVVVGNRNHLDPTKSAYWWLFGFDQLLHQLTNIAIIAVFLRPAS